MAEYDNGGRGQVLPYDVYFPPRIIEFEEKTYCIPNKIEEYLTYMYGRCYMQPPPVKHRKSVKPLEIKF